MLRPNAKSRTIGDLTIQVVGKPLPWAHSKVNRPAGLYMTYFN
jgi:hypothetical protein